jgi:hypothetical protein
MEDEKLTRKQRRDVKARSVLHRRKRQSIFRSITAELRIRPTVTCIIFASIFVGVCALVLGEDASRAFIILGGENGGALIAHVMGGLLCMGGILSLAGVARLGSLVELLGLGFVSAGAFIYGGGVLLGLGINGLIAGGFAIGISVGTALRVMLLASAATQLYDNASADEGDDSGEVK